MDVLIHVPPISPVVWFASPFHPDSLQSLASPASLANLHLSCRLLRRQMQMMITQIRITASSSAATAAIRMYGVRMSPLSHQAT